MKTFNKSFAQFLTVWSGQFISNIGSGLTAFSLGVYSYQKTQSASAFSLTILFAFLPSYLLRPVGGTLADRFNRKLLIIIGDAGSALGVIFIVAMMFLDFRDMWVIYTGVAISSVFMAFQNPAYKASVSDMLEPEEFTKASGLMQLAESSRYLFSPIIAGLLLHSFSIEQVLMIDILTFLIAIFTVFLVQTELPQTKQKTEAGFLEDLKEGFYYTFSNTALIWLLAITSFVTFAIGFMEALMGPMILAFSESKTLGMIQTLSVCGMLASSAFIGSFGKSTNKLKILSISLATAGLFYALFGTTTNIPGLVAIGFLFFASLPFVNTSLDVLIRSNVDNKLQGRVWSIVSLISQLGVVIALSTAGFLADRIFNPLLDKGGVLSNTVGHWIGTGPGRGIGLMFIISGLLVMLAAIYLSRTRSLRLLHHVQVESD